MTAEQHRGRLFGIAYRMLGQTYVGEWLPEPLAIGAHWSADHDVDVRSDLSLAFLVLLERLAPEERAAFLLREVFDEEYAAIGEVLGKSEQAVRQIVSRARKRVRTKQSRVHVEPEHRRQMLDGFLAALAAGDRDALLSMFSEDAAFASDGGGKVSATMRPVIGPERIVRLLLGIEAKWGGLFENRLDLINGEPGILSYTTEGQLFSATALAIIDGRIVNMYRVMNPDKLRTTKTAPKSG